MKINTKAGFTLIEIIIAMTLIAIFVTIPVFAYSSFTRSSRDTQRKNDINKIQGALEQYRANNGKYPPKETWLEDLVSGGYLPEIPTDPRDGQTVGDDSNLLYGYAYEVSDDGQTFQLTSLLENT
jgi:general secretion pathway protein G